MSELSNDAILAPRGPKLTTFELGECQAYVDWLATLWNSRQVEAMVGAFTESAEVEYGENPPTKGHGAIRKLLQDRFDGVSTYRLKKTARLSNRPLICVELDVQWSSIRDPQSMIRTRAFEIITIEDSKISKWEFVSNLHPRKQI